MNRLLAFLRIPIRWMLPGKAAPHATLQPDKARALVEVVAQVNGSAFATAADDSLAFLIGQFELLKTKANQYPRNPIAADVWLDGAALTAIADSLADEVARRGDLRREEHASRIATSMALQVMGHYPEQVFPRVLRQARCQEAINRPEDAVSGYDAIVSDYEVMGLGYLVDDHEPLDESGIAILTSVQRAAARLAELRPEARPGLEGLADATGRRLAK